MSSEPQSVLDAKTCYMLSKQQGVKMIAFLMGKTEKEVKTLIEEGERLMKEHKKKDKRR